MPGTTSDPIIKIYDPQDQTRFWDISSITTSVNIAYGRNQPFAVAEVTVKKAYFNSLQNYWDEIDTTPEDGQGNKELPSKYLVDGESPITIEAYGDSFDMFIERHEQKSGDDYITFLCYNKAYKIKNAITLNSLSQFVMYQGKVYFAYDTIHQNPLTNTITTQGKYLATCTLGATDTVQFNINVTQAQITSGGEVLAEYIQGTGSNIFKFIAMYGAGYAYNECICDNGYTYNYGTSVKKTYTSQEIQSIKAQPVIEDTQQTTIIKLRVNEDNRTCWDIVKSLGALSNRWPFFYDKAYFVDYNTASQTTAQNIHQLYAMNLDYGLDENHESLSYTKQTQQSDKIPLDIYEIVSNADQGSTYVQTSQKVFAEGYSTKVSISDIQDNRAGYDLYFPYPEADPTDVTVIDNSQRNKLSKQIAFNRVVTNYKPADAIQFKISEIASQNETIDVEDRIYSSEDELPQTAEEGDYALVIKETVMLTYYKYTSGSWAIDTTAFSMNDRVQRFDPYCVIDEVTDVQNGITIENAPLAYVELMWPSCLTQVTFGNPEFMDAQQQWSFLSLEAQVSTQEGTEDSLISDRYASKLVIGNQTMQNLDDQRTGFTGLIMEKNWDNDLYRLSGYNNGVLQAYFNSQGEIMSGNDKVIINENGITINPGGGHIDPSVAGGIPVWDDETAYAVDALVQWEGKIYTCLVANTGTEPGTSGQNTVWETSGNLSIWSVLDTYAVGDVVAYGGSLYTCILQTGATHYAPDTQSGRSYWQSTIDTSNQNVSIVGGSSTAYPQVDTTKQSKVVIDNYGLTTYNSSGSPVCRVGTDGNIYGINLSVSGVVTGVLSADHIDASSLTVGYATSQGSAGSATNSVNTQTVGKISNGYVEIDSNGLRTYSSNTSHTSSTLQCEVSSSTSGMITQGAGTVQLSNQGLLIKNSSGNNAQRLRFNDTWSDTSGWAIYATPADVQNPYFRILKYSSSSSSSMSLDLSNAMGLTIMTGTTYSTQGHYIDYNATPGTTGGYSGNRGFFILRGGLVSDLIFNFGFFDATNRGMDWVSFQKSFTTKCIQAGCSTIRYGTVIDGGDYVSGSTSQDTTVGTSGMYCRHDGGCGVYWYAIGY